MRLLIFTQKIDKNDTVLGFFHNWVKTFAENFEHITVICLYKGESDLPGNVKVLSLGKENEVSKLNYLKNLYKHLKSEEGLYDKVFVHMNQEYVILSGAYWWMKKIPVYFWRNHPNGSIATFLAVILSTKVFCTSKQSFTARFKKTVIMPAGIDIDIFKPIQGIVRKKYSVCMVGRVSPIKHIELGLEAIKKLVDDGTQISLTIIGDAVDRNLQYYETLKKYSIENNLSKVATFLPAVTMDKLSEVYSSYEICLNLTESGSFDKTIVEASSCGVIPLVSNSSLAHMLPEVCVTDNSPENIANSIKKLLVAHEQIKIQDSLGTFVKSQSLQDLRRKLIIEMQQ